MYLSRLTLNPRNAEAQRDLASPYQLHRTLAHAFGDAPEGLHRKTHGVLFRIEEPGPGGVPVLVQSASAPDWRRLPPGYTTRLDGPKAFAPAFADGQRLRFRLVANPVRRVSVDGKKHARREALVHPHAKDGTKTGYVDWLERQAERHGFTLPTAEATSGAVPQVEHVPFRLERKRKVGTGAIAKEKLPHFGVRFDGVLTVADPGRLAEAVRDGVGPAKAFGFGLLSVAPA